MLNRNRLLWAGFAAGVWVVISGMLMAGTFGYREMKAAFDVIGLAIPTGLGSMLLHTAVRLTMGAAVAMLYSVLLRGFPPSRAMLGAAGFSWLLVVLLPYAVIADWGILSWPLTAKLWLWGAVELVIASAIARLIYRRAQ